MINQPHYRLPWPNIEFIPGKIEGCYEIRPKLIEDSRGFFSKIFHRPSWKKNGLCTDFQEEYLTQSSKDVIRGLHFQVPPMQHSKVVICVKGSAFDVALDLRRGSPTYGEYSSYLLTGGETSAVYLPPGIAHGFCAMSDETVLYYKQSTIYSPEQDRGILWNSAGIPWPTSSPLISERDQRFQSLWDFRTPFVYDHA